MTGLFTAKGKEPEFQVCRDTGILTHLPTGGTVQLPADYTDEVLASAVERMLNKDTK